MIKLKPSVIDLDSGPSHHIEVIDDQAKQEAVKDDLP